MVIIIITLERTRARRHMPSGYQLDLDGSENKGRAITYLTVQRSGIQADLNFSTGQDCLQAAWPPGHTPRPVPLCRCMRLMSPLL